MVASDCIHGPAACAIGRHRKQHTPAGIARPDLGDKNEDRWSWQGGQHQVCDCTMVPMHHFIWHHIRDAHFPRSIRLRSAANQIDILIQQSAGVLVRLFMEQPSESGIISLHICNATAIENKRMFRVDVWKVEKAIQHVGIVNQK